MQEKEASHLRRLFSNVIIHYLKDKFNVFSCFPPLLFQIIDFCKKIIDFFYFSILKCARECDIILAYFKCARSRLEEVYVRKVYSVSDIVRKFMATVLQGATYQI